MSADRVLARLQIPSSRTEALSRISDAGLIGQGQVFLLSLEPIKAELGIRWPDRQDMVWDAIEKALVKRMPPPDVFLRLSPTAVLAAVSSLDSYDGQAICADVLRSILTFFLGRSVEEDLGISRVSSLGDDGLTADPINFSAPRPKRAKYQGGEARPCNASGPLAAMGRPQVSEFQSEHRGTVIISHQVVPVWRIDHGLVSAYALRQTLSVRSDILSDADREQFTLSAIEAAVPILEGFCNDGAPIALFVPCPFSVISARRPRLALLAHCVGVSEIMRRVVVLEIDGIQAGVASGLVRETLAMIKPFVRVVTVEVADNAETQRAFREAAFNVLTVNASNVTKTHLETVIRLGRHRTPNILVRDAPSTIDSDWLHSCGASHVSWMPPAEKIDREN